MLLEYFHGIIIIFFNSLLNVKTSKRWSLKVVFDFWNLTKILEVSLIRRDWLSNWKTICFPPMINLHFFTQGAWSYCIAYQWWQSRVPRMDKEQHEGLTFSSLTSLFNHMKAFCVIWGMNPPPKVTCKCINKLVCQLRNWNIYICCLVNMKFGFQVNIFCPWIPKLTANMRGGKLQGENCGSIGLHLRSEISTSKLLTALHIS